MKRKNSLDSYRRLYHHSLGRIYEIHILQSIHKWSIRIYRKTYRWFTICRLVKIYPIEDLLCLTGQSPTHWQRISLPMRYIFYQPYFLSIGFIKISIAERCHIVIPSDWPSVSGLWNRGIEKNDLMTWQVKQNVSAHFTIIPNRWSLLKQTMMAMYKIDEAL